MPTGPSNARPGRQIPAYMEVMLNIGIKSISGGLITVGFDSYISLQMPPDLLTSQWIKTVRYTDIPKISVLNQYRYIDTGYSTIPIFPIYRFFWYTGIFRYTVLNLPTIWRNHKSVRFYTEYVSFETASKWSFSLLELFKISFRKTGIPIISG
jgi:hypothetical protein